MRKFEIIWRFHLCGLNSEFNRKLLLILNLVFMLNACNDSDIKSPRDAAVSVSKNTSPNKMDFNALNKYDSFEISKSGCMSGCPFFNMRIDGDGEFKFQDFGGGGAVILTQGRLSKNDVKNLFEEIEDFNFEDFSAEKIKCEDAISDRTTESMQLVLANKTYKIVYNMGCQGFKNEEKLHEFERKLNYILKLEELSVRKK